MQRLAAGSDAQASLRLAEIYAHWGDAEQAFRWMEETRARLGVEAKESPQHRWAWELRFSPFLRPLHTDARWRELNARLFASSAVG